MRPVSLFAAALSAAIAATPAVMAQDEVNVYSALHYDDDDKLMTTSPQQPGSRSTGLKGTRMKSSSE